jgi:2-keto-4-pentenoate hydratase/2-oxohepta-3-ene-1,7-dioic acid hydratase in catechol pathway
LRANNAKLRDIAYGVKTKDEIRDPQKLAMWLDVNGEKRQRGNSSTMIFDRRHIERKSGSGMQAGSVVIG